MSPPVLIFVQSKERAQQLFFELVYENINVDVIHADRTEVQRNATVDKFRTGEIWILITTDLMSRYVHSLHVFTRSEAWISRASIWSSTLISHRALRATFTELVLPESVETDSVGRAGRAGRRGEAITFYTVDDQVQLKSIANVMHHSGCENVPEWILKGMPSLTSKEKKRLEKAPLKRESIETATITNPNAKMKHVKGWVPFDKIEKQMQESPIQDDDEDEEIESSEDEEDERPRVKKNKSDKKKQQDDDEEIQLSEDEDGGSEKIEADEDGVYYFDE